MLAGACQCQMMAPSQPDRRIPRPPCRGFHQTGGGHPPLGREPHHAGSLPLLQTPVRPDPDMTLQDLRDAQTAKALTYQDKYRDDVVYPDSDSFEGEDHKLWLIFSQIPVCSHIGSVLLSAHESHRQIHAADLLAKQPEISRCQETDD